jgi:hypothetical protein
VTDLIVESTRRGFVEIDVHGEIAVVNELVQKCRVVRGHDAGFDTGVDAGVRVGLVQPQVRSQVSRFIKR